MISEIDEKSNIERVVIIDFNQFSSIISIVNSNRLIMISETFELCIRKVLPFVIFLVLKRYLSFNSCFSSKCVENTKKLIESVLKTVFEKSDQLKPAKRKQRPLNKPPIIKVYRRGFLGQRFLKVLTPTNNKRSGHFPFSATYRVN